jgi:hypothetical protein
MIPSRDPFEFTHQGTPWTGQKDKTGESVSIVILLFLWHLADAAPALQPVVEAEESVYIYQSANNDAGALWCSGSTCLARIGDEIFASGLEALPEEKPLNNCRWTLLRRGAAGDFAIRSARQQNQRPIAPANLGRDTPFTEHSYRSFAADGPAAIRPSVEDRSSR